MLEASKKIKVQTPRVAGKHPALVSAKLDALSSTNTLVKASGVAPSVR